MAPEELERELDREKVIKGLKHCLHYNGSCLDCPYDGPNCQNDVLDDAVVLLKEQPEIVQCKDCKHWLPMDRFHQDYHPGRGDCELNCWVRDSDWFCADGDRR